jgi:hypothetical protein
MLRILRKSLVVAALGLMTHQTFAFTLLGPLTPWQTPLLSYDVNPSIPGFGPMNLGEEYRWNVPTVYYGFTKDFMDYFGQRGIDEVEKAIKVLNDLPTASEIDINKYPTGSARMNYRAQALGLSDVKTFALQVMLHEMGVGDSTRYVYSIRNREVIPPCPPIIYFVTRRNWDPFTWESTSYINGDLWTYNRIVDNCTGGPALLLPEPVDPMALLGLRHTPVSSLRVPLLYGSYFTTLTRDDVACLKYIYRPSNYNVENIPPGALGGTNSTLLGGLGSIGGSPWEVPLGALTNVTAGTTNVVGATNNFFEPALRGGLGKVNFVRVDYDSMMGAFFTPRTNVYEDKVILNNRQVSQVVGRVVAIPDILFDAADLQGGDTGVALVRSAYAVLAWDNNNDINGLNAAEVGGPGTIVPGGAAPSLVLTLNKVGPLWYNIWPSYTSEADSYELGRGPNRNLLWGSYDGSTNAPVIYPIGTSIQEIEEQVLGGSTGN